MRRKHGLSYEKFEARQMLDAAGLAPAAEPETDFALADVNSTSATFGQNVSPRDFTGQTSAYYFIHST